MTKLTIREAIVVEGRYDKNTLSQLVDALMLLYAARSCRLLSVPGL